MKKKLKAKYTTEFKIQALELAKQTESIAEAARQLGISDGLIHNWKSKYNFSLDSKAKNAKQAVGETEELARLRKKVSDLEKSNYILKRAAAFFSQDLLK